jgi:MFS family permease
MQKLLGENGYKALLIMLLCLMYTSTTISTNVLPTFFVEIRKSFNWNAEQVSFPNALYFIYIAIVAPFVGILLKRFSPRTLMLIGIVIAFVFELAITYMQNYTQYLLIYFALSIGITFSGLLPSMVIITNWFSKNRGLAVGVFLLGSSFGGIIYPQFAKWLIKTYELDWKQALQGVAVLGLVLSAIPWLFIKNKPETTETPEESTSKANSTLQLSDVLKSPVFYLLLLITAAFWFCGFGVLSHLRMYLNEHNYNREEAINVGSWFFTFSVVGKISFGYISDKYNKYNVLVVGTVFLIIGILALKYIDLSPNMAYLYAVAYGVGYSGAFTMIQTTVAQLYKGEDFSRVLGWVSSFDSIGGFLGVWSLGYFQVKTGNYDFSINFLLGICVLSLVMGIVLKIKSKTSFL